MRRVERQVRAPSETGLGLGLQVEEHREELGPGHPVHGGVVHLGDEADPVVGQPLDDPHLPQRLRPVELVAGDVPGQVGQLAQPARAGDRGQPHVVVDVEVGVVDPDRVAQPEGHLDQPAPEHRCPGDAGGDGLLHPLEGVAPGNGGRVQHHGHGHLHVEGRGLEVEEAGIEPAESFHARSFPGRRAVRPSGSDPCGFTSSARPCLMEGWPGSFLAVSIVFAVLVVNAFFPVATGAVHRGQLRPGMDPGRAAAARGGRRGGRPRGPGASGALHAWPGWVGLALVVASVPGSSGCPVVAHRPGTWWTAALGGAPPGGRSASRASSRRRRGTSGGGWSIAVPFRLRGIRRARNIDYWGDGNYRHKLDILSRRSVPPERAPVLVYIHGGAWVMGDKRQQGIPMMHELVQRGWVCVAINYRLSPRATWPAHIVDCKRAVAWVREHIAEYGGDPGFIAVSGGSAGGHLSSLLALTPNEPDWQPGFEDVDTSVDACVPFYGVYDMTGDPALSGAYGPGLAELLERRVMKTGHGRQPDPVRAGLARPPGNGGSAAHVRASTGSTTPWCRWRWPVTSWPSCAGSPRLRWPMSSCPRAQHAFDVMASIRCRHTTLGAVRFLEGHAGRRPPTGTAARWTGPRRTGPAPSPLVTGDLAVLDTRTSF